MYQLGLIGKPLSHSFSKAYFEKKFAVAPYTNFVYENYELNTLDDFPKLLKSHPGIIGLNVTIPYKEKILKYVDYQDDIVKKIGTTNTLIITANGSIKAYNTDVIGFKNSLEPMLTKTSYKALILGTGGASKAVAYALTQLQIPYLFVSRSPQNEQTISYKQLTESLVEAHQIVVNSTPLGTFPNLSTCPDFPFDFVGNRHIFYDLVYNPAQTLFMKKAQAKGAVVSNGLKMLQLQAEAAWQIWLKNIR